jgi:hypothetical protein
MELGARRPPMPLELDERRLLPPGVHDATLEEVERLFARFQRTDRRMTLFKKLKEYLADLRLTSWPCSVLIDGSFVMPPVDEPNDIDLILVMPADWDMGRTDLRPYEYNVLDRRHTKRQYKIEVYPVIPGSDAEQKFLDLFTRIRIEWSRQFGWPDDLRKGIVRLLP